MITILQYFGPSRTPHVKNKFAGGRESENIKCEQGCICNALIRCLFRSAAESKSAENADSIAFVLDGVNMNSPDTLHFGAGWSGGLQG